MLFALLEICRGLFQLLLETLGFVLGFLSLLKSMLRYLLGSLKLLLEISFLSGGFPLGNVEVTGARRIKSGKVTT